MTNESKQSPTSGSKGSESTPKTSAKSNPAVVVNGTMRLRSLTVGGDNPGTGMFIPPAGQIFEADAERGNALVACGLAEVAPEGAKGE